MKNIVSQFFKVEFGFTYETFVSLSLLPWLCKDYFLSFVSKAKYSLKNWLTLTFYFFLLGFVIALIWFLLLPQWTSQKRLKFSKVFLIYFINKFLIIGGQYWGLQTPLWSPLWQRWRKNQGDDRTKEKNKKQSKSIFQVQFSSMFEMFFSSSVSSENCIFVFSFFLLISVISLIWSS